MQSTIPPQPFPPATPVPAPRVPLQPPVVYVAASWEYKHVARPLAAGTPISEDELNALGAEGWELAAAIADAAHVHFYFKRERD